MVFKLGIVRDYIVLLAYGLIMADTSIIYTLDMNIGHILFYLAGVLWKVGVGRVGFEYSK